VYTKRLSASCVVVLCRSRARSRQLSGSAPPLPSVTRTRKLPGSGVQEIFPPFQSAFLLAGARLDTKGHPRPHRSLRSADCRPDLPGRFQPDLGSGRFSTRSPVEARFSPEGRTDPRRSAPAMSHCRPVPLRIRVKVGTRGERAHPAPALPPPAAARAPSPAPLKGSVGHLWQILVPRWRSQGKCGDRWVAAGTISSDLASGGPERRSRLVFHPLEPSARRCLPHEGP
jgi:hypothetical protein